MLLAVVFVYMVLASQFGSFVQPLVIMLSEDLGKPVALIHVADTWLLAESLPAAATPAWRVVQIYDGKRSFPGPTADLVKALAGLKAPEK
jgi:hypothetical protein